MIESEKVIYTDGYKYQLREPFLIKLDFRPDNDIITNYCAFTIDGWLVVSINYAWDGPSGPTYDSKNSMAGSLVHDVLYQLMREKLLPYGFRGKVDSLFYKLLRRAGMWYLRAKSWYHSVKNFAGKHAKPSSMKKVLYAKVDD